MPLQAQLVQAGPGAQEVPAGVAVLPDVTETTRARTGVGTGAAQGEQGGLDRTVLRRLRESRTTCLTTQGSSLR